MKNEIQDQTLIQYLNQGGQQIWIGTKAPFDMVTLDLLNSANYRASSVHHRKYDVVWFFETMLDDVGKLGWKILVDELIRLIGEEGRLIIRLWENRVPSGPLLKKFLFRRMGIETELEYEKLDRECGLWCFVFKIKRLNIEKYAADDWTFAMLTLGNKVDNVVRFLKSIRENDPRHDSEIIIVGPENEKYDEYDVKYIGLDRFRDGQYAEISKKKNAIIEMATKSNLMIVHDRFTLNSNFFSGFEKWGYDFDFATVSQYMLDGKEYPGYAASNDYFRFTGQLWVKELRHLYDNQYVNGGLVIFKTHTAKKIHFNDMLMWAQMEDVEVSQVCIENGIIPRVNFISEALVLEMSEGYLVNWKIEDTNRKKRKVTGLPPLFHAVNRVTSRIPGGYKKTWIYRKLKQIYWAGRNI